VSDRIFYRTGGKGGGKKRGVVWLLFVVLHAINGSQTRRHLALDVESHAQMADGKSQAAALWDGFSP
jgi:hypothetical protein